MKLILISVFGTLLLAACSPFNTVQLYRDSTSYRDFLNDREGCVREARECVAKTYTKPYLGAASSGPPLPSRGIYLSCMSSRGYWEVPTGFVPPVLALMSDYPADRPCGVR